MDSKIFLGKYRVAAEEIESVGEVADSPLAYEGEEIHSGRKVVVEVVPAGSLKKAVRDQLEIEAVAARNLNHVNIPALYDFGVEGDQLVYVSEDFDGTLAEEWVNAHGPMPLSPVLRIASQVVSALGAAAVYKIFHHAINPGNLVLVPGQTADGEWPLVKVLYFVGAAQKFSGVDDSVAAFDKSSVYTSPEQRRHGAIDFCSEIYSLGCTMWFLLTGAPPLVAQSGTTDLTADKANVPKKVARLLAQMLSVNRDERPHDPLAFYRQLQDCLIEVERREAAASHSKVPAISEINPVDEPRSQRRPIKALAFAAILLALAALTALVVSAYLRHRRIVLAEEPIGVPIGVDDASASATPVTANVIVEIASASRVAVAPASSAAPDALVSPPIQEPTPVTPTIASTPPAPINASELTSESKATVGASPLASPVSEPIAAIPSVTPQEIIMHEVRRAEPADEPEVRRGELARSDEGPAEVEPDRTPSSRQQTNSGAKTEPSRDVEAEATETTSLVLKRTDSNPEVAPKSPAGKTERPAKPKRQVDEKTYLLPGREFEAPPNGRLPRGSVRGRFMGVTADGRWMFELPSREIVTVLPPPSPR